MEEDWENNYSPNNILSSNSNMAIETDPGAGLEFKLNHC
jgi:hypothetical protein